MNPTLTGAFSIGHVKLSIVVRTGSSAELAMLSQHRWTHAAKHALQTTNQ